MLKKFFYRLAPDFSKDVRCVQSALTAHIDALAAGERPDRSQITQCLEALVAKGYGIERIGAINNEAMRRVFRIAQQQILEDCKLDAMMH